MRLVTAHLPDGALAVARLEGADLAELAAPTMVDWLAGRGREVTGRRVPLQAATLVAPVPEPPSASL